MNRAREESGEATARLAEEGPWLALTVLSLLPPAVTQTRHFTWTILADVVQWQGDEGWQLPARAETARCSWPSLEHPCSAAGGKCATGRDAGAVGGGGEMGDLLDCAGS